MTTMSRLRHFGKPSTTIETTDYIKNFAQVPHEFLPRRMYSYYYYSFDDYWYFDILLMTIGYLSDSLLFLRETKRLFCIIGCLL